MTQPGLNLASPMTRALTADLGIVYRIHHQIFNTSKNACWPIKIDKTLFLNLSKTEEINFKHQQYCNPIVPVTSCYNTSFHMHALTPSPATNSYNTQ